MRASFWGAVAGALGLHVVAILAICESPPEARRPAAVARVEARVVRVIEVPRVERPYSSSVPTLKPDTNRQPSSAHGKSTRVAEFQDPQHLYLETGSLDRTAEPVGEWALDTSILPVNGESKFEVSIWVSAHGEIEKWEVQSETVDADLADAIFARLNATVMNPALIGTRPVASVLRFELRAERQ